MTNEEFSRQVNAEVARLMAKGEMEAIKDELAGLDEEMDFLEKSRAKYVKRLAELKAMMEAKP